MMSPNRSLAQNHTIQRADDEMMCVVSAQVISIHLLLKIQQISLIGMFPWVKSII